MTPFALYFPSLKWVQPASPKNFYSLGFSGTPSHVFSFLFLQLHFNSNTIQRFVRLKNYISSDPAPTEFVLCLQNYLWALIKIIPFVSISCIWICFSFSSSLFNFQERRGLLSVFNNSSSTNLSFVSNMFEEVSLSFYPLNWPLGMSVEISTSFCH